MLWLGVDIGGTFTDAVLFDEARRRFRHAKAPSTPEDPTAGVLAALEGSGELAALNAAGVEIIVDTCVVVAPILPEAGGVLMTNSAKFAHYGPANTGFDVVYGGLADCVASAVAGRVIRDEALWR